MRENADQNNSEYGHFLRRSKKNPVNKSLRKVLKFTSFYMKEIVTDHLYGKKIFMVQRDSIKTCINIHIMGNNTFTEMDRWMHFLIY